jgi:hypothetical protein
LPSFFCLETLCSLLDGNPATGADTPVRIFLEIPFLPVFLRPVAPVDGACRRLWGAASPVWHDSAEVLEGRNRGLVCQQALFTGRIEGSLSAFPGFAACTVAIFAMNAERFGLPRATGFQPLFL